MIAYKAFEKGLVCRGYHFSIDKPNITDEANCRSNGFHCAENPIDCLRYYPRFNMSEYWIVDALGDIDEDDVDSKISCTEMHLIRRLDLKSYVCECLKYMYSHNDTKEYAPYIVGNEGICKNDNDFIIVTGLKPIGKGKLNSVIGFVKEDKYGNATDISMIYIDGKEFMPDVYYACDGTVVYSGATA